MNFGIITVLNFISWRGSLVIFLIFALTTCIRFKKKGSPLVILSLKYKTLTSVFSDIKSENFGSFLVQIIIIVIRKKKRKLFRRFSLCNQQWNLQVSTDIFKHYQGHVNEQIL